MLPFTTAPSSPPALGPNELHLWLAELDHLGHLAGSDVLSSDERERASRFRFERDRRCYVAARTILRDLLANYTGLDAHGIRFTYNAHGKPALPGVHPCRFNLGHSHGWAIYGFTLGRDVGVDIERIRPDFVGIDIAQRFFSRMEVQALRGVPEAEQAQAFFNCWTRKEAFIKAKGLGVFLGLHTFAVTLVPGEPAALLAHDGHPNAAAEWTMLELQVPEGFVGAAAIEGTNLAVRYWKWR